MKIAWLKAIREASNFADPTTDQPGAEGPFAEYMGNERFERREDLAATDFVCTQEDPGPRSRPLSPNELAWLEFIQARQPRP